MTKNLIVYIIFQIENCIINKFVVKNKQMLKYLLNKNA